MSKILTGDCVESMRSIPEQSVHCVVTSPPYWNLRDYGVEGQIGLEDTRGEYIERMMTVFSEVHRVLRDDGSLWLNIGDSYASGGKNRTRSQSIANTGLTGSTKTQSQSLKQKTKLSGAKRKELIGIPWRLAFALQDAGWYLRQDIIWLKPTAMPSSVKDRCTTAHEYVFLLTKSPKYYYDWFAISEPCSTKTNSRGHGINPKSKANGFKTKQNESSSSATSGTVDRRNKRSVWPIVSKGFKGAHFACFPPKLVEPCVLAGSPERCCSECDKGYKRKIEKVRVPTRPGNNTKVGRASAENGSIVGNRDPKRHTTKYKDLGCFKDCKCSTDQTKPSTVLDPFGGSGTTAQVAKQHGRNWVMCELNPEYVKFIEERTLTIRN